MSLGWINAEEFSFNTLLLMDRWIFNAIVPFLDNSFDIVVSGHVMGADHQAEWLEMSRVTKPGGYVIDCPGEDGRNKPEGPSKEWIELGFEYSHYGSKRGGDVYRYWKQKR